MVDLEISKEVSTHVEVEDQTAFECPFIKVMKFYQ